MNAELGRVEKRQSRRLDHESPLNFASGGATKFCPEDKESLSGAKPAGSCRVPPIYLRAKPKKFDALADIKRGHTQSLRKPAGKLPI